MLVDTPSDIFGHISLYVGPSDLGRLGLAARSLRTWEAGAAGESAWRTYFNRTFATPDSVPARTRLGSAAMTKPRGRWVDLSWKHLYRRELAQEVEITIVSLGGLQEN